MVRKGARDRVQGGIKTATAEVGHHLQREAPAPYVASMSQTYCTYSAGS